MTQYPQPPRYPPPYPPQAYGQPYGQGYGQIPYAQAYPLRRPAVVIWFYVYSLGLALLYAGVAALFAWLASEGELTSSDEVAATFVMVVCVPLMVVFAAAPLLPRRPWVWVYDLVLICIGMSGITFIICIPLLIYWLKPEAKAWFGRQA